MIENHDPADPEDYIMAGLDSLFGGMEEIGEDEVKKKIADAAECSPAVMNNFFLKEVFDEQP